MLKFKAISGIFILTMILLTAFDIYFPVSFLVDAIVILLYLAILAYGSVTLSMELFIPTVCKGDSSTGAIALTFDDGPIPGNTEKILEILRSHKVAAAFFCIGNRVVSNSALAKRIHNEGHLLGNHSYWHKSTFDLQSTEKIHHELVSTDTAIQQTIGVKPAFFRPPYGVTNPMVAKAILKQGYKTIGWSVRSFDTISKDREALLSRVTKSLKSGDVILFHDFCNVTIEILPDLLAHVSKCGLKIVRLDELLKEKAYVL
ncbi:polysaccharide deacetylase family protein [soil metagenome]